MKHSSLGTICGSLAAVTLVLSGCSQGFEGARNSPPSPPVTQAESALGDSPSPDSEPATAPVVDPRLRILMSKINLRATVQVSTGTPPVSHWGALHSTERLHLRYINMIKNRDETGVSKICDAWW